MCSTALPVRTAVALFVNAAAPPTCLFITGSQSVESWLKGTANRTVSGNICNKGLYHSTEKDGGGLFCTVNHGKPH